MFGDTVWIPYERTSAEPGIAQEIVAAERQAGGTFAPQTVAGTDRVDRLDAMLHAESGTFWVDWKSADTDFGHASAVERSLLGGRGERSPHDSAGYALSLNGGTRRIRI